jgi:hypothetical protein
MTVDGKETLFLTLAFVVPGFIWHCVQTPFLPRRTETTQLLFLRFLTFSCFNYAIWSWLIYVFLYSQFPINYPKWTAFLWGIMILISPVVMGVATGILSQKEFLRKLFNKACIKTVHSTPTAWEYKLFNTDYSVWVKITLKDGDEILGLYGSKSFASSSAEERDLYIQQTMKLNEKKEWQKIDRTDGILVKGDQIKYIEFIED